jgi:hypothetical protein
MDEERRSGRGRAVVSRGLRRGLDGPNGLVAGGRTTSGTSAAAAKYGASGTRLSPARIGRLSGPTPRTPADVSASRLARSVLSVDAAVDRPRDLLEAAERADGSGLIQRLHSVCGSTRARPAPRNLDEPPPGTRAARGRGFGGEQWTAGWLSAVVENHEETFLSNSGVKEPLVRMAANESSRVALVKKARARRRLLDVDANRRSVVLEGRPRPRSETVGYGRRFRHRDDPERDPRETTAGEKVAGLLGACDARPAEVRASTSASCIERETSSTTKGLPRFRGFFCVPSSARTASV